MIASCLAPEIMATLHVDRIWTNWQPFKVPTHATSNHCCNLQLS